MTSSAPRQRIEINAATRKPLGMPPARFLREYWQKQPLLIRGAFPDMRAPLSPEDLAGLACEEFALARIIEHHPTATAKTLGSGFRRNGEQKTNPRATGSDRWTVRDGPFVEKDFATLPDSHWTLLVQDVDKWDTDVAALRGHFAFLPSWRIDDVMVSYAADGGSVGAHIDQYDVFLLQGMGQRHWALSTNAAAPTDFRDDTELRLLREFVPTHEWILEPGDMLYLPPGIPHHGVAVGNCMTFSVGMRAPSKAELTTDLADHLASHWSDGDRYTDADLQAVRHDGEIDAATLARLRTVLPVGGPLDDATLRDWFGCFITRYRSAYSAAPRARAMSAAQFERQLARGTHALRNPLSRFAWAKAGRATHLYVAGELHACSRRLAKSLCTVGPQPIALAGDWSQADHAVLLALVNAGHLVTSKPDNQTGKPT